MLHSIHHRHRTDLVHARKRASGRAARRDRRAAASAAARARTRERRGRRERRRRRHDEREPHGTLRACAEGVFAASSVYSWPSFQRASPRRREPKVALSS